LYLSKESSKEFKSIKQTLKKKYKNNIVNSILKELCLNLEESIFELQDIQNASVVFKTISINFFVSMQALIIYLTKLFK